jgi:hypothetical protein
MWAGGLARSVYLLKPIRFPSVGLHVVESVSLYKPEARLQLVHAIDEAAVGIRNELGRVQWPNSTAQRLAACMQSSGGTF